MKPFHFKEAEYRAYRIILKELERLSKIDRSLKTPFLIQKGLPRGKKLPQHIDSSKDFLDKSKGWSGQEEIAAILAWQLYVKAQAYLDQKDEKNAHKFYTLAMKALKLSQDALKSHDLEVIQERLKKLEEQARLA